MSAPQEVLAFGVGHHTLKLEDFPWADVLVITAAGGAASDGTPGTVKTAAFFAMDLPPVLKVHCGAGSLDAQGRRCQDGYVLVELYGQPT